MIVNLSMLMMSWNESGVADAVFLAKYVFRTWKHRLRSVYSLCSFTRN